MDSNKKIDLAGFDCQLSSRFASMRGNYSKILFEKLDKIDKGIEVQDEISKYKMLTCLYSDLGIFIEFLNSSKVRGIHKLM